MDKTVLSQKLLIHKEPYRLFFPIGVLMLLWGTLIWIPQIWGDSSYPVLAHRFLMLDGFTTFFIAGFLMTAVPKFAQAKTADLAEIYSLMISSFLGVIFSYLNEESYAFIASGISGLIILTFLIRRITTKKVNPPYSFIFIFVGLSMWVVSSFLSAYEPLEVFKNLHSEAAIMAIILGVGSRLIPGILGHVEVVQGQRNKYESQQSFLKTVPASFYVLIITFITSYFLREEIGSWLRFIVVAIVGISYWRIFKFPKEKTALTWNIWGACWLIILSFLLKALWINGGIHAGHSFFFSGIVLLIFLIATRVLQSHGPGIKKLENYKVLYVVNGLVVLAGATRVSAILMPDGYLRHLSYSSFTLTIGILLWSFYYLRYVRVSR